MVDAAEEEEVVRLAAPAVAVGDDVGEVEPGVEAAAGELAPPPGPGEDGPPDLLGHVAPRRPGGVGGAAGPAPDAERVLVVEVVRGEDLQGLPLREAAVGPARDEAAAAAEVHHAGLAHEEGHPLDGNAPERLLAAAGHAPLEVEGGLLFGGGEPGDGLPGERLRRRTGRLLEAGGSLAGPQGPPHLEEAGEGGGLVGVEAAVEEPLLEPRPPVQSAAEGVEGAPLGGGEPEALGELPHGGEAELLVVIPPGEGGQRPGVLDEEADPEGTAAAEALEKAGRGGSLRNMPGPVRS